MTSNLTPNTTIYVHDNFNNNRPKIRIDCSFLGSPRGLVKLLEVIISIISAVIFCVFATFKYAIDSRYGHKSNLNEDVMLSMSITYIFYRVLLYVLTFSVKPMIIFYLFHVVEKYDKIPWYTIEYIVSTTCIIFNLTCGISTSVLCGLLKQHNYSIEPLFYVAGFLSYGVIALFIYDIVLVYSRQKLKKPPQD